MGRELDAVSLERCRRGDASAFRTLVECYQDRVFALCVALAGRADAEDLAQETFARAHAALGRFDPSGSATLGGWLLTIARRLCADRARGARLRVEVAVGVPVGPADDRGPEERLVRARLGDRLRAAIAALPDDQRAVIALREWDGLDYNEIAAIEAVPVGTVRSRLARARQALREALAGDERGIHAAEG
jgi:RNA polymerase sigma-70 factor (ECF subfamily)